MISAQGLDIDDASWEAELEQLVGPVGKWRETRDFQISALNRLRISPSTRFVDMGCGVLRVGAPLIAFLDRGCFVGVDVSQKRLDMAKRVVEHLSLEGKQPRLLCSSQFGRDQLQPASIDAIWCYQVVIHLDIEQLRALLGAVSDLLAAQGKAWISLKPGPDGAPLSQTGHWSEFPITQAGVDFYADQARLAGLDFRDLGSLGEWGLPAERGGATNRLIELKPLRAGG